MPLTQSFDQRSPHRLVGDLAGVDGADHRGQLLDPRGHPAMHLADPVDLVARRVFRAGAADPAGRVELGAERIAAIAPTVRPQPTMPAMRSSLMQFCKLTT